MDTCLHAVARHCGTQAWNSQFQIDTIGVGSLYAHFIHLLHQIELVKIWE